MTPKELRTMIDDAYQTGFNDGCASGQVWRNEDGTWGGTMHRQTQIADARVKAMSEQGRPDDGD